MNAELKFHIIYNKVLMTKGTFLAKHIKYRSCIWLVLLHLFWTDSNASFFLGLEMWKYSKVSFYAIIVS